MNLNRNKLERVIEVAKKRAAGQTRWINAIDKAVEGLLGTWIVTELQDGIMVTTENGTYHANGKCSCVAYQRNQPCKHRAAARIVSMYREAEKSAPVSPFVARETAPMRKPQPTGVFLNGWKI